jgi:hypothetical protein
MEDRQKTLKIIALTVVLICILGIIRELSPRQTKQRTSQSNSAQSQEVAPKTDAVEISAPNKNYTTPKIISIKVDKLLAKAREAVATQDYDRGIDFYYDAILLEPEILGKWNKERYIGDELDIIKKVRKTIYLPKRRSEDARERLMKINYILSEWYKGCKKKR